MVLIEYFQRFLKTKKNAVLCLVFCSSRQCTRANRIKRSKTIISMHLIQIPYKLSCLNDFSSEKIGSILLLALLVVLSLLFHFGIC